MRWKCQLIEEVLHVKDPLFITEWQSWSPARGPSDSTSPTGLCMQEQNTFDHKYAPRSRASVTDWEALASEDLPLLFVQQRGHGPKLTAGCAACSWNLKMWNRPAWFNCSTAYVSTQEEWNACVSMHFLPKANICFSALKTPNMTVLTYHTRTQTYLVAYNSPFCKETKSTTWAQDQLHASNFLDATAITKTVYSIQPSIHAEKFRLQ